MKDPFKAELHKVKNALEENKYLGCEKKLYKIFEYVFVMDMQREDLIPSRREVAGKIGYKFLHFDEWYTKEKSQLRELREMIY